MLIELGVHLYAYYAVFTTYFCAADRFIITDSFMRFCQNHVPIWIEGTPASKVMAM